jgi:mono/diheme cytochrome c family protein
MANISTLPPPPNKAKQSHQVGPIFGGMMSLACVSCHGNDGRGGTHYMHMQVMEAPDIRYSALSAEAGEHAEEMEHTQAEYTIDAFQLAVIEGKHPNGDSLSADMPRWQIDTTDLEDLLAYLKSLP